MGRKAGEFFLFMPRICLHFFFLFEAGTHTVACAGLELTM